MTTFILFTELKQTIGKTSVGSVFILVENPNEAFEIKVL